MQYKDLRDFINQLEKQGELKRITAEIDPYLEMTEICDRTLRAGGPALLFENPKGSSIPVLGNLFGTARRVAMGMGEDSVEALHEVGRLLAFLKEPDPPKGIKEAWQTLPVFKQVLNMSPRVVKKAACQEEVLRQEQVDLSQYPIQTCWPEDASPLIHGGWWRQKDRKKIGRIWAFTASRLLAGIASSCAGFLIAVVRWTFTNGKRSIPENHSRLQ